MSEIVLAPRSRWLGFRPSRRHVALALFAVAVLATVLGAMLLAPATRFAAAPVPQNPAIESKWGIRVTQVASTGDGGMVDFRFIVLDPDKASAMMADVGNLPVMIPEAQPGSVVNTAASMGARHDLRAGLTYFLLYRNTNGAVKPGTRVTVVFGDLRIEHVVVR